MAAGQRKLPNPSHSRHRVTAPHSEQTKSAVLVGQLELNHHAVLLSTATAPYDTLTLRATPRNVRGEPLPALAAPHYTSTDLEHVGVTSEASAWSSPVRAEASAGCWRTRSRRGHRSPRRPEHTSASSFSRYVELVRTNAPGPSPPATDARVTSRKTTVDNYRSGDATKLPD